MSSPSPIDEAIAALQAKVASENTVIDSAITLLAGLSAQIRALPASRQAIEALADLVDEKTEALAAAVQAGT